MPDLDDWANTPLQASSSKTFAESSIEFNCKLKSVFKLLTGSIFAFVAQV